MAEFKQIGELMPKALEALIPSTQERPISTKALDELSDFQTFDDPKLTRMRDETARFLTAYRARSRPYWLSLLGPSGIGKSYLAKMAFNGSVYPWYEVMSWIRGDDRKGHDKFLDLALSRHFDAYEGKYTYDKSIVVLDDIGAEYVTDYSKSKLCEFLDRREQKWTMLTANMSIAQIGHLLDPRIASRMLRHDSVVVEVDLPDFSLREK
jgi:DNA replication protein DnaC